MLPMLIVLFLISYALLALLVVEQAHTIDAQRSLIRQLFTDSVELTTLKGKNFQQQHPHSAVVPKPQTPSSQVQTPSSQSPSSPLSQGKTTSPGVGPESKIADPNHSNKMHRKPLEKLPKDWSDNSDDRRSLNSI